MVWVVWLRLQTSKVAKVILTPLPPAYCLTPVLIYRPRKDERLSWPEHGEWTVKLGSISVRDLFQLTYFLLLALYVPNVTKRSIWDQCKKKYIIEDRPSTDRPTNDRPLIWENFKWPYLRKGSSDPLHVWFKVGVFEVGGSNGAISGLTKFNRYVGKTTREE